MVRGRILLVVCVGLAVTGGLHADMTPVAGAESDWRSAAGAEGAVENPTVGIEWAGLSDFCGVADFRALPFDFPPESDAEPDAETPPVSVLTEGQCSLHLCLYALVGLGVFHSGSYVKRLHLGHIPDWYHHGGPAEIGGHLAVRPDCLVDAALCFVQPDAACPLLPEQYHRATIAPLLRKSQFTPTALASRGPPRMS